MRLDSRRIALGLVSGVWIALGAAVTEAGKTYTQQPTLAASVDTAGHRQAGQPAAQPQGTREFALLKSGPEVRWIWGDAEGGKQYWLRKEFESAGGSAELIATCDNRMKVLLNGQVVAESDEWQSPVRKWLGKGAVRKGKNVLLVEARNDGGPAGFALKLAVELRDGKTEYLVSDESWQAGEKAQADAWKPVAVIGAMGIGPWQDVFAKSPAALPAVQANVFHTLPGFRVELLFTVPKDELGSWVCLTVDPKGRLIASDQGDKGLCRITPPAIGSDDPAQIEHLDLDITAAQGLLFAFDSLYISVNGGPGSGLYRARYDAQNDEFGPVEKLVELRGAGEHGPHALRVSPDGKSLFIVAGNHTQPPFKSGEDNENPNYSSRIATNWNEDLLLPRQWDARGHARGILAPGGWIARTDPDGKTWEIFSIGYRNAYDMAFNAEGELFTYDSDMEWDMGTPWYRPTRVCHATSGSEFGWRSGTGKWPTYYLDSLPPMIDIGPGSPVGVEFGYGTKYPARYQRALFICDWTFGTIYALHLKPQGASYTATKEEFLSRTPLPLTDLVVGPDGAMYFAVGGRGTQSELFRVSYAGEEPTSPVDPHDQEFAELRQLRRELEALHRPPREGEETSVVAFLTKHLSHPDRFIRYAARAGLERRDAAANPVDGDADAVLNWAVAAARWWQPPQPQPPVVDTIARLDFSSLPERLKLDYLRALSLAFIRLGEPDAQTAGRFIAILDPHFPSESDPLNRELSQMLVYLKSPTVISKALKLLERDYPRSPAEISQLLARNPGYGGTIAQMLANQPELEKVHFAFVLRNLRYGWTLEQRKQYFEFLAQARTKSGGASYEGFIDNIRKEALENASEAERKALEGMVALTPPRLEELPKPVGPGRDWTTAAVVELAQAGLTGRDFENGKRTFAAAQCVRCHRFDGEGGATGQDLTNVAGRFSIQDLAEAIVDPSKVISDQYRASTILTVDGKTVNGRILSEQNGLITVLVDPVDVTKIVEVKKDDVEEITPSKASLMPNDLLDSLNPDEVLDLLAYLLSRGNPNDLAFAK